MQALLVVLCAAAAMLQVQETNLGFDVTLTSKTSVRPTPANSTSPATGKVAQKIGARIVGGVKASRGMFPWQALIEGDGGICGGALISANVVLTAAHCLKGVKEFKVTLGLQRLSGGRRDGRVVHRTRNKVLHKNFVPGVLENDIGLLKLPRRVKLGKFIDTVRLPTLGEAGDTYLGQRATASGWGSTADDGKASDELNFLANRTIIATTVCSKLYGPVGSQQLCVDGSGGKAICRGDSGGPLTLKGDDGVAVLIGLVSFSHPDTCFGHPQVFTRVASYLRWIAQNSNIKIQDR